MRCVMDYKIFIPVLVSFALSAIMGPVIIPVLRNLKMGQTEREEGVKEHLKKAGTPTMGGVIILLSILITSLFYIRSNPQIIPVLFVTIGFGLIGFLDDYLKVVMKRSDGLFPKQKMALQIIVTAIFAYYLVKVAGISLKMLVPFSGGRYLDLGWLAIPVLFFAVIGTVNGVNFTDGLDGLASSVTVLVATFFTVVAIGTKSGIEPVTGAVVGALLGFLLFNVYPASVFMGDTGFIRSKYRSIAVNDLPSCRFDIPLPLMKCLCLFLVIFCFKDHQIHHSPYQKKYNSKSRKEYYTYLFSVICSVLQSEKPHNTIPYSLRFVLRGYAYLFFFLFNRYRNYHIYRNIHHYHSSIHPMQVHILHTDCLNFPMYHWYMQFL